MKRFTIYLLILSAAAVSSISQATAQELTESEHRLIFSARAKLYPGGLEISFEHPLSERFSLRTALGHDFRQKGDYTYHNREVSLSMLSNSRIYPYGFTIGPYIKLKDSYYSYSHPIPESMLDAYSSFYFFGAGVTTEYRQKIGSRFMVSPFARFGINKVLIRRDYGPGEPFFTDSFETDAVAGFAVHFIF
jgi:hypothetical protein